MTRHAFLFGGNIFQWDGFGGNSEQQAMYRALFRQLFNYATLPFYWALYEPTPGATTESRLRDMATWCVDNGVRPKGHPLIWQQLVPYWATSYTTHQMGVALQGRVTSIVSGFAGLIDTFDVINESLAGPSFSNPLGQWEAAFGATEAARQAFSWAKSANPSAMLLINDYDNSAAYSSEVAALQTAGQPPSAVGIQSHMHQGVWSDATLWAICERFRPLGIPVHFTETTILSGALMADNDWSTTRSDWPTTEAGEQQQATSVLDFYRLLFSHPSVQAITWWDVTDANAWLGAPAGLLRKDLTAKPAYNVLMKLIHDEWWTRIDGQTDAQGQLKFRGFYGSYQVVANGKTMDFTLDASGTGTITVTLP